MSYQLAILRHAKSDWNAGLPDFERPLNNRGQQDAPKIGVWLKNEQWQPDSIIASPAQRARETILAVTQAAAIPAAKIAWNESLYLASMNGLLNTVKALPADTHHAMLVGHNPGMEDLVEYLSSGTLPLTDTGKLFTTANLALFEFDRPWSQLKAHSGKLLHLVRPKDL